LFPVSQFFFSLAHQPLSALHLSFLRNSTFPFPCSGLAKAQILVCTEVDSQGSSSRHPGRVFFSSFAMVRARKAGKLHSLFSLSHAEPRTQAMGVAACTGKFFPLLLWVQGSNQNRELPSLLL
ncbi:hypothetical protein VIGAN_04278700, partial [Vigna angularis var. angularis]